MGNCIGKYMRRRKGKSKYLISFVVCVVLVAACAAGNGNHMRMPDIAVDPSNLRATVKFLTEIEPPRNYKNLDSLNRVVAYIAKAFETHGLSVEIQRFEAGGRTYANVIGILNPLKKSRVIVGAHYDVYGDLPGADDNASGVAGLLEVARLAKKHALDSAYRFEFVAYALEEPPFFMTEKMGSHVHAKSLSDKQIDVRAMICLEMIGYFTDEPKSQAFPMRLMKFFYPDRGNFIAVVGNLGSGKLVRQVRKHMRAADIPVESLSAPSWVTGVDFSDHRNYWKFGYKAVMITDTSFYRNANYHQITDTMETLDFTKMQEVVRGIVFALTASDF